ncbi:MAG: 3-deoxy-manno-octulosonate cytidylyltransferase [Rhodospirillaceae bacterium]|nr:3-deoxy-manno-octulosonate cytidylyltransferase [Rhodospirillaceae bacterium]
MNLPKNPIILIPARMSSVRLPNKPLAIINGDPMIVHVWRRAVEAKLGRVVVACGEDEILKVIQKAGGEAVLTDPSEPSGSDRIFSALQTLDPSCEHDAVLNIQGDLPVLESSTIESAWMLLSNNNVDIGTAAAPITIYEERHNPSVVKAIVSWEEDKPKGRALYFTRATAPSGEGPLFHHIGLYAYRREALEKFVTLPLSPLEKREKLEQLRALENGMRIDVALVDTVPFGVDTPEDLERARKLL